MMEEILCDMTYNPEINTYWFWAIQLLMLKDTGDNTNWLVNNFIEIVYEKEGLPRDIYFFNDIVRNKMVEFYNCPLWQTQKIDFDENHLIFGKNIVQFVQESIRRKKYVLLMINRKYLKTYGYTDDNLHQILIHGFDDDKQEIYYADNQRNGKFANLLICTYDELMEGFSKSFPFKDEPDFSTSIFTFYTRKVQEYPINLLRIKRMISSYYFCNSQTEDSRSSGISVYLALIDYYDDCIENNKRINTDVRGLCTLRDHQNAMGFRLNQLQEHYPIRSEWIKVYMECIKKSELSIKLMIKYRIDENLNNIKKINVLLKQIYEAEKDVLPEVLEFIENLCVKI